MSSTGDDFASVIANRRSNYFPGGESDHDSAVAVEVRVEVTPAAEVDQEASLDYWQNRVEESEGTEPLAFEPVAAPAEEVDEAELEAAASSDEGQERKTYWTSAHKDPDSEYWGAVVEEFKNRPVVAVDLPSQPPANPSSLNDNDEELDEEGASNLEYWQEIANSTALDEDVADGASSSSSSESEVEAEPEPDHEPAQPQEPEVPEAQKVVLKKVVAGWQSEAGKSNVEVLEKIAGEVDEEEDKEKVSKLLRWAKATRKPITETFKLRKKKRQDDIRRTADFSSVDMVIVDRSTASADGSVTLVQSPTGGRQFEISQAPAEEAFQVRKSSVIQPASETVVTHQWVENAIRIHEQEEDVHVIEMRFDAKKGNQYEAEITAKVGPAVSKEYHWVIREAPRQGAQYDKSDKDVFMASELGRKIAAFVISKKLKRRLTVPFQPLVMSDSQYAIFENMKHFKQYADDTGFDLDHVKAALRGLAKLHAMSYAYLNSSKDDIKESSEMLKYIVNPGYQAFSNADVKAATKDEIESSFENLLKLVSATGGEGADLAKQLRDKFGKRLYNIYRDAHDSGSGFAVLCHGYPTARNIHFDYDPKLQKPSDVKFTGFHNARYASATTDLQLLFSTSMGPRVEEQSEFLMRFVYYEKLASTLKLLGVDGPIVEYEALMKDFKTKQLYGCLAGAVHLAELLSPTAVAAGPKRASGRRVFESKLVGKMGTGEVRTFEAATPILRIKALLERAMHL